MAEIGFMPPGLRGFLAGEQANQRREAQGLQQLLGMTQLQQHIQAQQAAAKKMQLEDAFRKEISQAKTPEEQAAVAVRYGGPEGILKHLDREATRGSTRELAMARLTQAAQQFENNYQLRLRAATTQEERLILERQREAFRQQLQGEAVRLAGARANYDFGFMPASATPPTVSPTPPAPSGGTLPPSAPPPGLSLVLSNSKDYMSAPPEDQASLRTLLAATEQGKRGSVLSGAPDVFIPSVAAVSAPPRAAAQAEAPITRASQYGPEGRFPPVGIAPVAPPLTTQSVVGGTPAITPTLPAMPPEIASSPRRVQDQWRLQQTKPSIAGNAPITPETASRLAQQALAGDNTVLTGWARNQAAMAQINNEITRQANELGVSGGEISQRKASNIANRTALVSVTKDLAAITPFKQMLDQNADIAINLGKRIADDKTSSAFVNKPLLWVKNNLSDRPDIAEYLAQMHFVEVEAARVLTQPRLVGQLTDQAISDMKSVVSGNMTIASTEAVLRRIQADGNNRINAMKTQQSRIRSDLQGAPARTRSEDKPRADQFFR